MRVIVFGGSGFLGSHVADALLYAGYEVTLYDIRESPYIKPGQKMIVGDILDARKVYEAVLGCDVIYNFAGIADIDECLKRPADVVKYNILSNVIILDGAIKANVKRFVFASSVYVFNQVGSFYCTSKRASEMFIEDYHKLHKLPYTILRYGSLYGQRADERNSIYRILKQALSTGVIEYYGTGEETREYIHVMDAAALSVKILSKEYENQHIILTGNQSIKYGDLLNMVKEMLDNKVQVVYNERKGSTHYKYTPYSFSPKLGKKMVINPFIDMAQGLLHCMKDIYIEINRDKYENMGMFVEAKREAII